MKRNNESGILSLEAAMLMPLFIMLMLFIYGFMIFFAGSQLMSHAALQTAQSLSLDSYSNEKIASAGHDALLEFTVNGRNLFSNGFAADVGWYKEPTKVKKAVENRFKAYLLNGDNADKNGLLKFIGIENGEIDYSGCNVDNGVLTIKIKYKQSFMFNVFDLMNFDRTITVKAKMWGI